MKIGTTEMQEAPICLGLFDLLDSLEPVISILQVLVVFLLSTTRLEIFLSDLFPYSDIKCEDWTTGCVYICW
jgi:hypothetical protein